MPHEAYRTSIHETTKATPFSLMFVQLPIDIMIGKPLGVTTTSTSEYARALTQQLVAPYEHGREHLGIEQRRHKQLYDRKTLDDEPMPDESGHEEHSLDESTENEALIQDRSTDETTSENHYKEVLVERWMILCQLVETGEDTEENPENLVPKMDDNMESEDKVQGTLEGPEEEGLRRSTWERKPAT
eukprot:Em0008g589a